MEITVNGASHACEQPCTLAALLVALEVNPRRVAVEVNEMLVPRAAHDQHLLQPGDRLEIVTLVGGG